MSMIWRALMDLILVVIPASFRTIVTDVEDTALVITNFNVLWGKHPPPPPPPTGLEDNAAPPAPLRNEEPMLQQAAALGIVPITTEEDIVTQNLNNRISLISKYLSIYLEISVQNFLFAICLITIFSTNLCLHQFLCRFHSQNLSSEKDLRKQTLASETHEEEEKEEIKHELLQVEILIQVLLTWSRSPSRCWTFETTSRARSWSLMSTPRSTSFDTKHSHTRVNRLMTEHLMVQTPRVQ